MTAPEPQVGDIVVYVGDNPNLSWRTRRDERAEFIVTQVAEDSTGVHAVELHLPEHPKWREKDWIIVRADVLRVMRRASYTDVSAADDEGAERKAKIALARMLRCSHCRDIELARLGVQS